MVRWFAVINLCDEFFHFYLMANQSTRFLKTVGAHCPRIELKLANASEASSESSWVLYQDCEWCLNLETK